MRSKLTLLLLSAGLTILTSCSKIETYSCKCKILGDETVVRVYEQTKKKEAKSQCKDFEKQNADYTDCKISEL